MSGKSRCRHFVHRKQKLAQKETEAAAPEKVTVRPLLPAAECTWAGGGEAGTRLLLNAEGRLTGKACSSIWGLTAVQNPSFPAKAALGKSPRRCRCRALASPCPRTGEIQKTQLCRRTRPPAPTQSTAPGSEPYAPFLRTR